MAQPNPAQQQHRKRWKPKTPSINEKKGKDPLEMEYDSMLAELETMEQMVSQRYEEGDGEAQSDFEVDKILARARIQGSRQAMTMDELFRFVEPNLENYEAAAEATSGAGGVQGGSRRSRSERSTSRTSNGHRLVLDTVKIETHHSDSALEVAVVPLSPEKGQTSEEAIVHKPPSTPFTIKPPSSPDGKWLVHTADRFWLTPRYDAANNPKTLKDTAYHNSRPFETPAKKSATRRRRRRRRADTVAGHSAHSHEKFSTYRRDFSPSQSWPQRQQQIACTWDSLEKERAEKEKKSIERSREVSRRKNRRAATGGGASGKSSTLKVEVKKGQRTSAVDRLPDIAHSPESQGSGGTFAKFGYIYQYDDSTSYGMPVGEWQYDNEGNLTYSDSGPSSPGSPGSPSTMFDDTFGDGIVPPPIMEDPHLTHSAQPKVVDAHESAPEFKPKPTEPSILARSPTGPMSFTLANTFPIEDEDGADGISGKRRESYQANEFRTLSAVTKWELPHRSHPILGDVYKKPWHPATPKTNVEVKRRYRWGGTKYSPPRPETVGHHSIPGRAISPSKSPPPRTTLHWPFETPFMSPVSVGDNHMVREWARWYDEDGSGEQPRSFSTPPTSNFNLLSDSRRSLHSRESSRSRQSPQTSDDPLATQVRTALRLHRKKSAVNLTGNTIARVSSPPKQPLMAADPQQATPSPTMEERRVASKFFTFGEKTLQDHEPE